MLVYVGVNIFNYQYCSFKPEPCYKFLHEWFIENKNDCLDAAHIMTFWDPPYIYFIPSKKSIYLQFEVHEETPEETYVFFSPYPKDNCLFQELKKANVMVSGYGLYTGEIKDNPIKVKL